MKSSAKQWRKSVKNTEKVLITVPSKKKITISYENVCRDPEQTLSQIYEWLGVDEDFANDWRDRLQNQQHQIPGNHVLFKGINNIKLDQAWRVQLTEEDIKVFNLIARKVNSKYGYI
jgi:hypothetical protein